LRRATEHWELADLHLCDDGVHQAQANLVVIIAVLDGYRFGLSQSLLGATVFVKTLRSPYTFLMCGGLALACFQSVPLLAKRRRQSESIMSSRIRIMYVVLVIAVLVATGAMLGTSAAQNTSAPKQQGNLALGEGEVKKLVLLMHTDNEGKVSKQEFMSFVSVSRRPSFHRPVAFECDSRT
jgi:uncharacterized membrane protein